MNPRAAVAVLLLLPGLAAAEPAAYEQALAKARQSFVTQKQGQPTLDTAVKLTPPADSAKKREFADIQAAVEGAKEVQLGCVAPCTSTGEIQIYRGKVELVAGRLGLKPIEVQKAVANYLPENKPRIRGANGQGPSNPADQELERRVLQRLLASETLAPQVREQLNRRALAMAEALGRTSIVASDADGLAVSAGAQRHSLTSQEIARLNAVPQTQAAILRRLVANPPPPPLTAGERQQRVLDEAEREIKNNPGYARQAQGFWKTVSQDTSANPLLRGYAYANRGLLALSGLGEVEDAAARTGYVAFSDDVGTGRKVWEATKLAGDSVLFAANFVGLTSAGKVYSGVQAFEQPIVVDGVRAVGRETAELVTQHTAQISESLRPAFAAGGRDFKAATAALNEYAAREFPGVMTVGRGGKIGQANWIAEESKILYNPFVGEAHEFAHAHQMFVTRASALELVAKGRPLSALAPEEVNQALQLANRFEAAHYAKYEAQALRSSGFMGLAPGADYSAKLAANGREISQAMMAQPQWNFTKAQAIFGSASGLGSSQREIAMSLLPVFNIPILRKKTTTAGEILTDTIAYQLQSAAPSGASH